MQWRARTLATFEQRPGRSPKELGVSYQEGNCPDIWITSSGDYVVIGTDVSDKYDSIECRPSQRAVMIPAATFDSAAAVDSAQVCGRS